MSAPPYIQLTSTLWYLHQRLLADSELHRALDVSPQQVVSSTLGFRPIHETSKEVALYRTELPVLAVHELHSEVVSRKPHRVFECEWMLWYLLRIPVAQVDEGRAVAGPEYAARWAEQVWDRVDAYIAEGRFDREEGPWDLASDGHVNRIRTGRCRMHDDGHLAGFTVRMPVRRTEGPQVTLHPAVANWLVVQLHVGSDVPTTEGPVVEAKTSVPEND